jgi:hypothetical protein
MRTLRTFGLLAIILMIATSTILAASVTIPAANTNTTSNRKPFGSFFGFERTAAIYTAAEHGMAPGSTVTDVCWYVNAVTTPDTVPVVIYMSTTTATTFTASTFASEIAGASTVFTGTILNTSLIAGSFRCVALTAPFAYTANNLKVMVQTDFGGGGNETSTAKQFRWSAGASQTWQADNAAPAGGGTTSTTSRPNAQLIFNPPAGPGTLQFSSATYGGNEGTTATITVNRVGGSDGAVSVDYATSDGTATGADYTPATGTLNWAAADSAPKTFTVPLTTDLVADPGETVNLTLSNVVGTTITGTNPATLTITDVPPPFSGAYTVGTAGAYTSLTNAGGIFEAINLAGASGAVTINVISDLTGETGLNSLNAITGSPAVLIKPSGAPRLITGSSASHIIRLNEADNITIDGSTAASVVGGNPALRELTIENTNTGTSSSVIVLSGVTNGTQNNRLKNLVVKGNASTTTLLGISIGGATAGVAGVDNDNNTVQNCDVTQAIFGIYSAGESVANQNTGTVIRENSVGTIQRTGIVMFNDNGAIVTENSVTGIVSAANADSVGIGLGVGASDASFSSTAVASGGITNALVTRNRISGVSQTNTWGAAGIGIAGDVAGVNIIANNMITGVVSDSTAPDITAGIFVAGVSGSTTRIFYNSISMTGDRGATAGLPSYGIAITGVDPTVELKNNIFYTTQVATGSGVDAFSYAIGMVTTTFANLDSSNNDFFSTGANDGGFRTGSLGAAAGTNYADLAAWNAATGDDPVTTSFEVDPGFVNPLNDLHLALISSPLADKGIAVSVLDDFDGNIRSIVGLTGGIPDIGSDEFVGPSAAGANVRGRLISPYGRSLANASVSILNTSSGETLTTRSNQIGYFNFADLPVGNVYIVVVNSKRFSFDSYTFTLNEDLTDIVLTAISNNIKQ